MYSKGKGVPVQASVYGVVVQQYSSSTVYRYHQRYAQLAVSTQR